MLALLALDARELGETGAASQVPTLALEDRRLEGTGADRTVR